MNALGAAAAAARRGWAVFPCLPRDKRPAVDRWEARACADPERVARYWPSDRHNVGVACGPSRLVVIDLDTAEHGGELPDNWRIPGVVNGLDVLAVLCERAGQPWPCTFTVRTPLGGWHLYFQAVSGREIRNSAGKAGPMIDVRGGGGYVLAAGSVIDERAYADNPAGAAIVKGGKAYEIIDGSPPVPLPEWLTGLADPPRSTPESASINAARGLSDRVAARFDSLIATVLSARVTQRNNTLFWAASRAAEMVAAGQITSGQVHACLGEAAICVGLTERESERTIASALRGDRLGGAA